MTPKISVIVPVYNAERFLPGCVKSIISQTFIDWELILVEDGSPDNSSEICDAYAEKDNRIKAFHKQNGGVSSARNVGLDNAKGEWICFVDSDDMLTPDAIACMYHCVEQTGADVCLCPIVRQDIICDNSQKVFSIEEKSELIRSCLAYRTDNYFAFGYMVDAPHGKLFRKSIIQDHKIRFIEGLSKSEDAIFDAWFYHYARTIVMYMHQVYCYTINPNSISHTFNWKIIDMLVQVLKEEKQFVMENYPNNSSFYEALNVRAFVGLEQILYESGTLSLSFFQHVKALKLYLDSSTANSLLKQCTSDLLQKHIAGRSRLVDLFFAKLKLPLSLYLWTKIQRCLFDLQVITVERAKRLLKINPNDSIWVLFSKK